MVLYHGTDCIFDKIDLSKSKNHRDFGKGFYLTTIFEQAEKWAKNQQLRNNSKNAFVKVFQFEKNDDLKIKIFSDMNKDWLEFVKQCRNYGGTPHSFDVITGPVANDNTMRTIAFYISGIYTAEQAIEQLKFFKVNNQFSFHTQKALNCLKWLEDKKF